MVWFIFMKHLMIFMLGVVFTLVSTALVISYYMYKSSRVKLSKDVQFIEDEKEGIMYFNKFKSYKNALYTYYSLLFRQISRNNSSIGYVDNNRARTVFNASPIVLLGSLLAFIILCLPFALL